MKKGYLSQYFKGVAIKRLSAVEADLMTSNQHEFNGVQQLKNILGAPVGKVRYNTKFIYMSDDDSEICTDEGFLTWYDARENHPSRSECRLYFSTNTPMQNAAFGDLLVIAQRTDDSLIALMAKRDSTIEQQILWLFGIDKFDGQQFTVRENLETDKDRLNFTSRFILEEIGIEIEDKEGENFLDVMISRFNGVFPSTNIFSEFARSTLPDVSSRDNPDTTLLAWMEREEVLFKTLERHILEDKIKQGFGDDIVAGFINLSLSVQNRRKSRAGSALENHLEKIFIDHGIPYSREKITENKHRPDFIFPSIEKYQDSTFPSEKLFMLAAKTTCKERWRQILNEAVRVEKKHLLTLEPSISEDQTNEMAKENVRLVVPAEIHRSYNQEQQKWLMTLGEFINEIIKGKL